MKFDGIIFDLDGTLWDACQAVAASWTYTLQTRFGQDAVITESDARAIMGMNEQGVADNAFGRFGENAYRYCHGCIMDEGRYIAQHKSAKVYPGVFDTMRSLRESTPLFIVSNCQCGYIEAFFDCSGCEKFIVEHQCEGSTGKSKRDNILQIIQSHGLKKPVYVGDTYSDEDAARGAGCTFIHAAYGFGNARQADGSIHQITELPALLERL